MGLGARLGCVSSSCQNFLTRSAFPQFGDIRNGLIWHELLTWPRAGLGEGHKKATIVSRDFIS
ncbi:hypothetical protein B1A55_04660 [Corynebacterium diphtheriae]|nr:hypothetical protein BKD86_0204675 [Corynebacterium diphtheriae]OSQ16167.1 hypothetical protein B1A55_04660 [Corynebacterium diphtheriae]OWX97029.1 hypothetical protein B1A56_04665 [Corynebacterium diphtheriae]